MRLLILAITTISVQAFAGLSLASTTYYCTGTSASMEQVSASAGYQFVSIVQDGAKITVTRKPDSAVLTANASGTPNIYNVDQNDSSFSETDDSELFLDPTVSFDGQKIVIAYHGPEAQKNAQGKHASSDTYLNCNTQSW